MDAFSIRSVTDCLSIAISGTKMSPPGIGPATDRTLRLTDITGESARAPYTRADATMLRTGRRKNRNLERLNGWKIWTDTARQRGSLKESL
ncbi:MAG: hypothetical protein HY655_11660 [Acidobacteria bacterium]|nr:hypothetical protein [Acidobacteriota bacterium]